MRVLLLADDDDLYARGATTLEEGGHEVVACHDSGSAARRWPCAGVTDTCPLDTGVDAAVALRRSGAGPVESGIGCVVRGKVPLVLGGAGGGALDGVAPYASQIVEGIGPELAGAVDRVAAAPIAELSRAAEEGLAGVAQRLGITGPLGAAVHRHGRSITVVIEGGDDLEAGARSALAQAAYAPVRELVPTGAVDTIDVGFGGEVSAV